MKNVVERVEHLIALATSPNENEARNAAMLAVQLIRKHCLVLSNPGEIAGAAARGRTNHDPGRPAARSSSRWRAAAEEPPSPKRSRSSKGQRRVADPPERIVAPLGGDCVACGARYRADATIYWFASGGGMHPKCFDDWSKSSK